MRLDGQPLGTLKMPRHLSFGIGAQLKDPAGNVLALLCTAETKKPQGFSSNSYQSSRAAAPIPGAGAFLRRVVCVGDDQARADDRHCPDCQRAGRADGQGPHLHGIRRMEPWQPEVEVRERIGARILTICTPTAGEKPARHHVQCAAGVDVALQVCLMYAAKLANDELFRADNTN